MKGGGVQTSAAISVSGARGLPKRSLHNARRVPVSNGGLRNGVRGSVAMISRAGKRDTSLKLVPEVRTRESENMTKMRKMRQFHLRLTTENLSEMHEINSHLPRDPLWSFLGKQGTGSVRFRTEFFVKRAIFVRIFGVPAMGKKLCVE